MKNSFETQEKINDLIPNPTGIPCHSDDSDMIRKEHNRWKSDVSERKNNKQSAVSYWKNVSACISL